MLTAQAFFKLLKEYYHNDIDLAKEYKNVLFGLQDETSYQSFDGTIYARSAYKELENRAINENYNNFSKAYQMQCSFISPLSTLQPNMQYPKTIGQKWVFAHAN